MLMADPLRMSHPQPQRSNKNGLLGRFIIRCSVTTAGVGTPAESGPGPYNDWGVAVESSVQLSVDGNWRSLGESSTSMRVLHQARLLFLFVKICGPWLPDKKLSFNLLSLQLEALYSGGGCFDWGGLVQACRKNRPVKTEGDLSSCFSLLRSCIFRCILLAGELAVPS
jgi:hypothetical protein